MPINVPTKNTTDSRDFAEITEKDLLWEASYQINNKNPSKAALLVDFVISAIAQEQEGNKTEKKIGRETEKLLPADIYIQISKENPSLQKLMDKALDEIVQDSFSHPSKLKDTEGENKADNTFSSFVEQHPSKTQENEEKSHGIEPINHSRRNFLKQTATLSVGTIFGGGVVASIMETKNIEEKKHITEILNNNIDKETGEINFKQALNDSLDVDKYDKSSFIAIATIGAALSAASLHMSNKHDKQEYKDNVIGEVFDAIDNRIELEMNGIDKKGEISR